MRRCVYAAIRFPPRCGGKGLGHQRQRLYSWIACWGQRKSRNVSNRAVGSSGEFVLFWHSEKALPCWLLWEHDPGSVLNPLPATVSAKGNMYFQSCLFCFISPMLGKLCGKERNSQGDTFSMAVQSQSWTPPTRLAFDDMPRLCCEMVSWFFSPPFYCRIVSYLAWVTPRMGSFIFPVSCLGWLLWPEACSCLFVICQWPRELVQNTLYRVWGFCGVTV